MYGRGGWVFVPLHELPIRKLTAAQRRENAAARKGWRQKRDKILAIAKRANEQAKKYGGYIPHEVDSYDDGDLGLPELKLPHEPGRYDVENFTEKDRAVFSYGIGDRFGSTTKDELVALEDVVKAGVQVVVSFGGVSASSFAVRRSDFERDGPPVPDFINDNWWRA